ncbi:MAG TPA: hypothetical protein VJN70_00790, partial [Gemmatimonadaceae bacterium]|nr:hypothetical protein [Gemmatimonadaceae bacterium]
EELMALSRVVRRVLNADVNAAISKLETSDLARQDLTLGAKRAAGEGDDRASVFGAVARTGNHRGEE